MLLCYVIVIVVVILLLLLLFTYWLLFFFFFLFRDAAQIETRAIQMFYLIFKLKLEKKMRNFQNDLTFLKFIVMK